mgnify:CR=1 FL=1
MTLALINFELQKLAVVTAGSNNHLITENIVKLGKEDFLTDERLAGIVQGYDDFLFQLLNDNFKNKYKELLEEVMSHIFKVVGEFNQKQITASFTAAKAEKDRQIQCGTYEP